MSVNVGQRNVPDTPSNQRCYAVDSCEHLCRHVLKITSSKSVLESPHADLAQRLRDLVMGAYACAYTANRIDMRIKDRFWLKARLDSQRQAISCLNEMMGFIPMASSLFKWRKGKREYWVRLGKQAMDLAWAWHGSDAKNVSALMEGEDI